jgi:O-antigen ligase
MQTASWTPSSLHHPIWQVVNGGLIAGSKDYISINPFDTVTETMKLLCYCAVGWLAFVLSIRHERAHKLFLALFFVGVSYSAYGMLLSVIETSQITLLEGVPPPYGHDVSGGLVAKNSFATSAGMLLLVSLALVVDASANSIVTWRGWRPLAQTVLQFIFGRGATWIFGSIVIFSALVAADSRAGLIATLVGLAAAFCFALILSVRRQSVGWTLLGAAVVAGAIVGLFLIAGGTIGARFDNLIETAGAGDFRPYMWHAAEQAIVKHPFTGLGLGTYHDAYHLYADQFTPYVVDRAHNDYLELTMGLGIPAALAWFISLAWLNIRCAIGALRRHRRRAYSIVAIASTALVGFHSIFDFSLQIPAVSIYYAVLMGIGLAQSEPNRNLEL